MLLIICVEILLHIGSHFSLGKWQRRPNFPTKLAAAASFSYKIGGGGKDLVTLLAAVLTWSGYWSFTLADGGLIFLQNRRRRPVFDNITGGCSDMVWILELTG